MYTILSVVIFIIVLKVWRRNARRLKLPYPPGPVGLPLIGNVSDLQPQHMWISTAELSKEYGDVIHLEILGHHIIILNTLETVKDLLDGRSAIYSDRERSPMVYELMGWEWTTAALHYGHAWKSQRRLFHQYFNEEKVLTYCGLQTVEARRTSLRLIDSQEELLDQIRLNFATVITQIVYGIRIDDTEDTHFKTAKHILQELGDAVIPGAYLVDLLPFLKYVPSWMPGAHFKRKAKRSKEMMPHFVESPFNEAVRRIRSGVAVSSMISDRLSHNTEELSKKDTQELVDVAATAFAGGADTTVSTLQTFFLAMVLFPEVQRKARTQIDEVVGRNRLPEFDDLQRLPYVQAVFKELLRWQPVLPLALPHRLMRDDEYHGYHMPEGAVVFGNAWSILHSEDAYTDPMAFKPERFLNEDGSLNQTVLDPDAAAFGFGRRKCPGRFFASNGGIISLATFLAVLDVSGDCDRSQMDKGLRGIMNGNTLSYPHKFDCKIRARSSAAYTLLKEAVQH